MGRRQRTTCTKQRATKIKGTKFGCSRKTALLYLCKKSEFFFFFNGIQIRILCCTFFSNRDIVEYHLCTWKDSLFPPTSLEQILNKNLKTKKTIFRASFLSFLLTNSVTKFFKRRTG